MSHADPRVLDALQVTSPWRAIFWSGLARHWTMRIGSTHTPGGLACRRARVPRAGDAFERAGCRFEIVDMDGNRVDRVLASRIGRDAHEDARPTHAE